MDVWDLWNIVSEVNDIHYQETKEVVSIDQEDGWFIPVEV